MKIVFISRLALILNAILFFNIFIYTKNNNYYDTVINLGGDCQVFYQLSANNMRSRTLPFDYLITPCSSLCRLLENKFRGFLDIINLMLVKNEQNHPIHIEETLYKIYMIHDFELNACFLNNYQSVKDTYERRIKRFLDMINKSKRVLFIRKTITKQDAIKLSKVIKETFSHLEDFTLVALDTNEEIKQDWTIDHVKNFYLRQPNPYVWSGDNQAWKEILDQFKI